MKIWMHKGFIMIDASDNQEMYNKLYMSTFLSRHPSREGCFYFSANNTGLKFFKKYYDIFKHFIWSQEVEDFYNLDEVNYIERRKNLLVRTQFQGIVFKPHQDIALNYMAKYKQFCIFLGPGTGKTLIALNFIDMLKEDGEYLIFTPAKAINQYINEAKKYLPYAHVYDYRKGSSIPNYKINIGILNYESAHKVDAKKTYKALILDESHKCKSPSTNIYKTIKDIKAENTYLFSGTPQDKNRHEVFSQFSLMNHDLLTTKYLFFNRYFVVDDYNKPISEKRPEELAEIIERVSYGDDSENLLALSDSNEYVVDCSLGPMKDTYTKFSKTKVLRGKGWFALGDTPPKFRSKKTQLCCGFIIDEDGIAHRTPYNPKEKPFLDTLMKCPKAIIYTCYDEEQVILQELLKGKKFACVNGKLKKKECDQNILDMKEGKIDYLVMQIQSGNAALDFPMIDNTIYYSLHDSYIYFEQSKYRIRRLGKTNPCNYYYLLTKGTVEKDRFRSVKNKKNFNDSEKSYYRKRI